MLIIILIARKLLLALGGSGGVIEIEPKGRWMLRVAGAAWSTTAGGAGFGCSRAIHPAEFRKRGLVH